MQGKVKMRVTINESGTPTKAEWIDGDQEFVDAARKYLLGCTYTPAILDGQPISVTKIEVVNFKLR
jgi:hypothetical protein